MDLKLFKKEINVDLDLQVKELQAITSVKNSVDQVKASTVLANAKNVIDLIENTRKVLNSPYQEKIYEINSIAKDLSNLFTNDVDRIKNMILVYKKDEAEKIRIQQEELKEKQEKEKEVYNEKQDFILRNHIMIIAKTFGGYYFTKDGEQIDTNGIMDIKEGKALLSALQNKFPKPETFPGELKALAKKLITNGSAAIEKRITLLNDIFEMPEEERKTILENERQKGIKTIETVMAKRGIERNVKEATEHTETKKLELKAKTVTKGIRKNLRFKVVSPNEVPIMYTTVDEKKISSFMNLRRNMIRKLLDENNGVIPDDQNPIDGVQFYYEETLTK